MFDALRLPQRLLQQQREIQRLRAENAALKAQNASMRDGMRRCVTCEYRLDFKARQGGADT
ncbi:MAG: hypothetical protein KDI09_17025 [Halioglobus sp.]|nr:hypothetical protein [Halioglobus sp.]